MTTDSDYADHHSGDVDHPTKLAFVSSLSHADSLMNSISRLACLWVLAASAFAIPVADGAIVRDFPPGLHVPEQAAAGPTFDV